MTNFASTSDLYELASSWEGRSYLVEHAAIEAFSASVTRLLLELGDERNEDFWVPTIGPLKRLRWTLATTPLPISHPACNVRGTAEEVVPRLKNVGNFSPSLAAEADLIAEQLAALGSCDDDPLGDAVRQVTPEEPEDVVLLLTDGRSVAEVNAAFGETSRTLTAPQLLRTVTRTVIAVGPPTASWFPAEVLRAPRAQSFTFVYFGWLRATPPALDLLIGSEHHVRSALAPPPLREASQLEPHPPDAEDADGWKPSIQWPAVTRAAKRIDTEGYGEPVPAFLFVLVSGDGVYLEAKDGANAHVAELDEDINVRQAPIATLSDGDFLIVRTAGEGDYIRELADSILGRRATQLRNTQAHWKRKLATEIEQSGLHAVCGKLSSLGSNRASEENVRRWVSPDSIRTWDRADFAAICQLVDEPVDQTWNAMADIAAAHQRAGQEVRRLLVNEIRQGDTASLLQRGWSDYDVESIDGEGTLRVARIAGRSPDVSEIAHSRLRKLFTISEDQWLG